MKFDSKSKNPHNFQRNETYEETLARWKWFDDEDGLVTKPEHYDDPMVKKVDTWKRFVQVKKDVHSEDQVKQMNNQINRNLNNYGQNDLPIARIKDRKNNPLLRSPNKYEPNNKDSYISSGKPQGQLSTWELMKATANSPEEKLEIKQQLHREYKKNKSWLSPDELRLINKHPDQIKEQVKALSEAVIPKEIIEPVIQRRASTYYTNPPVDIDKLINERSKMKPGISEDLIKLQSAINKNVEYVMGKKDDTESEKEINNNTIKDTNDA